MVWSSWRWKIVQIKVALFKRLTNFFVSPIAFSTRSSLNFNWRIRRLCSYFSIWHSVLYCPQTTSILFTSAECKAYPQAQTDDGQMLHCISMILLTFSVSAGWNVTVRNRRRLKRKRKSENSALRGFPLFPHSRTADFYTVGWSTFNSLIWLVSVTAVFKSNTFSINLYMFKL